MKKDRFQGKSVLILGFGEEGKDAYEFIKKQGVSVIAIADKNEQIATPEHVAKYTGPSYLDAVQQYNIIVRSPGVPYHLISPLLSSNQELTSSTNIFFEECVAPIIGVTGTKGKSTTCALLSAMLKQWGKNVYTVGNMGNPCLSALEHITPEDIVVYELSSFQLIDMKKSPHIAIFLNISLDHLDHHKDYKEYVQAKARITVLQGPKDIFIYNQEDEEVSLVASLSKAQKIPFKPGSSPIKTTWAAPIEPVLAVANIFSIPDEIIQKTIETFLPLEHRLEQVGEWNGITFINDSAATTPRSTLRALDILGKSVKTLILGGSSKGSSYRELAQRILDSSIQTLVLFPTTGKEIEKEILALGRDHPMIQHVSSMEEAVQACYEQTPRGSTCLLSPASASFSMFSNYKERGEKFKKLAKHYGQANA
ncbi:MAG: UDP-N-acetylmuramoyl-L-alanine--D-glutamate ligase [bacterium]|nr:UDP-N-acetylmuramoyl-L-alanine--D-glutamate ligase [bacterium]